MAWTPERADRLLRRLGFEPFAFEPDPARFDPLAEPTWSLMMVLAWIVWRTPEKVREHWEEYRAECREWGAWLPFDLRSGSGPGAREYGRRRPAELRDLKRGQGEAVAALMRELRDGQCLRAHGRLPGERRVDIPAREWRDLVIIDGAPIARRRGGEADREEVFVAMRRSVLPAYEDVQLERAAVLEAFPSNALPAGSEADVKPQSPAAVEPAPAFAGTYRSGASGRPSSKHLVASRVAELRSSGATFPSQAKAADALAAWLRDAHQDAASMTAKTIRTEMGAALRPLVKRPETPRPKTS